MIGCRTSWIGSRMNSSVCRTSRIKLQNMQDRLQDEQDNQDFSAGQAG